MENRADGAHREREHFFGAAKSVAGLTVLSRIAGMFRATAIASLGANALTDAFSLAFKIPNLFRRLFAEGALSSAFVPVFTQTSESPDAGPEQAKALLASATGILGVFLLVLMFVVQAGLLVWGVFWPGPQDRQLMILLAWIMLPFMVTICLLALGSAALNCRGHFLYPAAAPILLNVIIIAAAWGVAPLFGGDLPAKLMVVGVGMTVAGVVQLVGAVRVLRRAGLSLRPRLWPVHPAIRPMLRLMVPMLIPLGLQQLLQFLESAIAWVLRAQEGAKYINILGMELPRPLEPGVLQRLDAAGYLYQFPLGVLAISLGVAVFPLLSRYAARNDIPSLRDALNRALRLALMEGLATGMGLFLLAEPITWVLYRHGRFTAADVAQSAGILRMYVLGMWALCSYQILVRCFYALKDMITPLKISCVLAAVDLVLVATLIWVPGLGARAFGLATTITFSVNAIVLVFLLRRRLGRLGGRKLAASVARSVLACAAMAGAILVLKWVLGQLVHEEGQRNWVIVGACVPAGAAVFFAAAWALRCPELKELLGARAARSAGSPPPDARDPG